MDVKALFISAIGPRNDVRGAKQRRLCDARQRTATAPVIHEGLAENILANALDHQPLGFSGLRQPYRLEAKTREWRVGQADGKLVDAIERQGNRVKESCGEEACEEVVVPGGGFAPKAE